MIDALRDKISRAPIWRQRPNIRSPGQRAPAAWLNFKLVFQNPGAPRFPPTPGGRSERSADLGEQDGVGGKAKRKRKRHGPELVAASFWFRPNRLIACLPFPTVILST